MCGCEMDGSREWDSSVAHVSSFDGFVAEKERVRVYLFCDGALVGVAVILYTHRIAIRGSEFSRI